MPTITVRVSDQEKRRLSNTEHSRSRSERSSNSTEYEEVRELIGKLEKLQNKNRIRTTTAEEVRLIKQDRGR